MKATQFHAPIDSPVTSAQVHAAYDAVLQHIDSNSPDVRVVEGKRYKRRYTMRVSLSERLCAQLSLPQGMLCEFDGVLGKHMAFALISCDKMSS